MKKLILLIAVLLAAGCGSLSVQVSVLRPQIVEDETDRLILRRDLQGVLALQDSTITQEYADLSRLHSQVLSRLRAEYLAKGTQTAKLAAESLNTTYTTVGGKYEDEGRAVLALVTRIRAAAASPGRTQEAASLVWQLERRKANFLHEIQRGMSNDIRNAQRAALPISDLNSVVEQHAELSNHLLIGDANITIQPAAFVIANAEDSQSLSSSKDRVWAPIFDRSYGAGQFGKTDIAIKMEARGVFSIKGISFDASQTARVASKVASQGLMLASQLAGVPIKSGTFTGDGVALANSSGTLQAAEEQSATADAKLQDKKNALMEFAMMIIAQRPSITSGDADKMKSAVASINAKLTSTKTRLSAN